MFRFLSATLITTFLLLSSTSQSGLSRAGTCASHCKSDLIQFKPGQYLRLQVVNHTFNPIKLERLPAMERFTLLPGKELQIAHDGTKENLSLFFWNDRGDPMVAIASKPDLGTLHLEIRFSRENAGEHSLYLMNDGYVNLF